MVVYTWLNTGCLPVFKQWSLTCPNTNFSVQTMVVYLRPNNGCLLRALVREPKPSLLPHPRKRVFNVYWWRCERDFGEKERTVVSSRPPPPLPSPCPTPPLSGELLGELLAVLIVRARVHGLVLVGRFVVQQAVVEVVAVHHLIAVLRALALLVWKRARKLIRPLPRVVTFKMFV